LTGITKRRLHLDQNETQRLCPIWFGLSC